MADSALVKKLLLKPSWKALVFNPPAGYVDGLKPLPEGVELVVRVFFRNETRFLNVFSAGPHLT